MSKLDDAVEAYKQRAEIGALVVARAGLKADIKALFLELIGKNEEPINDKLFPEVLEEHKAINAVLRNLAEAVEAL